MKRQGSATALLLDVALSPAQAATTATPTHALVVVRGGVDLVEIDAIVTRGRKPVTDLKADDVLVAIVRTSGGIDILQRDTLFTAPRRARSPDTGTLPAAADSPRCRS